MNTTMGAPILHFSRATLIHSAIQLVQLRWSLLSPSKSGYGHLPLVSVYLAEVGCCTAEPAPPELYGGAGDDASEEPVGELSDFLQGVAPDDLNHVSPLLSVRRRQRAQGYRARDVMCTAAALKKPAGFAGFRWWYFTKC